MALSQNRRASKTRNLIRGYKLVSLLYKAPSGSAEGRSKPRFFFLDYGNTNGKFVFCLHPIRSKKSIDCFSYLLPIQSCFVEVINSPVVDGTSYKQIITSPRCCVKLSTFLYLMSTAGAGEYNNKYI